MEGDKFLVNDILQLYISIHSLRMEGDCMMLFTAKKQKTFQSTPSAWRETKAAIKGNAAEIISIHSLRMEGDYCSFRTFGGTEHFNPLPPHGGRHCTVCGISVLFNFNPLPPHGGRRISTLVKQALTEISIHSLRMEGD